MEIEFPNIFPLAHRLLSLHGLAILYDKLGNQQAPTFIIKTISHRDLAPVIFDLLTNFYTWKKSRRNRSGYFDSNQLEYLDLISQLNVPLLFPGYPYVDCPRTTMLELLIYRFLRVFGIAVTQLTQSVNRSLSWRWKHTASLGIKVYGYD